ncbi:MAG: hypothetical protein ABI632_13930, partial [Pseudolysinimonas sp.]
MSPMIPSTRNPLSLPRTRIAVALAAIAALVISVGAAAAAAPPVLLAQATTVDYHVELTQSQDGWIDASLHNTSAATIAFGLSATMHSVDTFEPVWTTAWDDLAEFSRADVAPGQTYEAQIPAWSGMGISVMRDIDTTPISTLEYRIPGQWFAFDVQQVSATDIALQFGHRVTVTPAVGRKNESLHVSVAGLSLTSAEVWVVPAAELDLISEGQWDFGTTNATSLGTVPISAGAVSASVQFPDLAVGDYAVLVGEAGGDFVPGGPRIIFSEETGDATMFNLQIEAGEPRSLTPAGNAVDVQPLDQNGSQPVSFSFPTESAPGTTRVTTSTTGPTPTGFTTLTGTASPAYYELETTATFGGQVEVCISFDTTGLTPEEAEDQHLYHFVAGVWQDITSSAEVGLVCGLTTSFSPFAIGRPLPAPPTTWPFTGFLDLSKTAVNAQFAGAIVPIRFKVGGDRGLSILATGAPVSGQVPCNATAPPASVQATNA